jgi:hypothetical protein
LAFESSIEVFILSLTGNPLVFDNKTNYLFSYTPIIESKKVTLHNSIYESKTPTVILSELEVEAGLDPVKAFDTTSEESVMDCRAKI